MAEIHKASILTETSFIPFAKAPSRPPLLLGFRELRNLGTQRRLQGRVALVPEVDLNAYSFRAVIDWIEIGLGLQAPKQFMQLQKVLGPVLGLPPDRTLRVDGLDEGPGHMATRFAIRIQEPRLDRVLQAVAALDRVYPLAGGGAVLVRALEVSIDARPRVPSDEPRGLLLGALGRTLFTQREVWGRERDRPRFNYGRGRPTFTCPKAPLAAASLDDWLSLPKTKRLPADATFYVGERDGDVMWRVMDKVVDRQNVEAGTQVELGEQERRVRVEVALGWQELHRLGLRELHELKTFSFTKLQGSYFSFRLPTFCDPTGTPSAKTLCARVVETGRRRTFCDVGILGLHARDASREAWLKPHREELRADLRRRGRDPERQRAGTGSTGTTIAWQEMSKKVETALRHLQERVRSEMERGAQVGIGSA